jgi:hypothetical protein
VKVGDKVELSAAGKKLAFLSPFVGKTGTLIVKTGGNHYTVEWDSRTYCYQRGNDLQRHRREDLVYSRKHERQQ